MNNIKICLISPLPPPQGGIARWTKLIHDYTARQSEIKIIQINTAQHWRSVYDSAIWKRIIFGGIQLIKDYVKLLMALSKQPDVIHLTTSGHLGLIRDFLICLTANFVKTPLIYHIRGGRIPEIFTQKNWEWRIIDKNIKMASLVIALENKTAQTVKDKLPGTRLEVIPNPVDINEIQFLTKNQMLRDNVNVNNKKIVFFLGWVIPTKGIEELVKVWFELIPNSWRLLIAGPVNKNYQTELMHKYPNDSVEFLGELNHSTSMQYLAQSDIFTLPSYTEGFPNVILEAMALGKPIIATSVGAIPDMLSNHCGIVIEPKDVEGLKKAIFTLSQNEQLRYQLGQRAYQKAKHEYSLDVIFGKYRDAWQIAIKKPP